MNSKYIIRGTEKILGFMNKGHINKGYTIPQFNNKCFSYCTYFGLS